MKQGILSLLTSLLVAVAFIGGVVLSPDGDPDVRYDGCVIRLLSTGPILLNDDNHHCSSTVTGVSVNGSGYLVITYEPMTEVMGCSAEEDETLTDRGVQAGASVGLSRSTVRFTVAGVHVAANSATVTGANSNIFWECHSTLPPV